MVRLQPYLPDYNHIWQVTFNPTMVRLQLHCSLYITKMSSTFQSHYGAIATHTDIHNPLPARPFNPTMVRLQQCRRKSPLVCQKLFQSHYGAIATLNPFSDLNSGFSLSIPLWCDCNTEDFLSFLEETLLSIPLWCDCNLDADAEQPPPELLSIPLWCDCNPCHPTPSANEPSPFNPTMVRLQPS